MITNRNVLRITILTPEKVRERWRDIESQREDNVGHNDTQASGSELTQTGPQVEAADTRAGGGCGCH